MSQCDYTKDEQLIAEALIAARRVQDYLWADISLLKFSFDSDTWARVFQKRVNKIHAISEITNAATCTELRKRVLQQAALSIMALKVLDGVYDKLPPGDITPFNSPMNQLLDMLNRIKDNPEFSNVDPHTFINSLIHKVERDFLPQEEAMFDRIK